MVIRFLARMVSVVLGALGGSVAYGQDYPNKPIRFITTGVGGATNLSARMVAQGISGPLGQQVIVENRSVNPATIVAKAPHDGYTLLFVGGSLTQEPLLRDVGYDPIKDFLPISRISRSPSVITVHPAVPANSLKELIALAKAKPGTLNYGSIGVSTASRLGAELLKSMAGINIVSIPYKTVGELTTAIISNEIQILVDTPGATTPHVKAGKLRALAVTSAEPSMLTPGLPTVAASGLPGYDLNILTGVYAPAHTSKAIIDRLNREIVRYINSPGVKQEFFSISVEVGSSTPQQLATELKTQTDLWRKTIKDAGIKAEG